MFTIPSRSDSPSPCSQNLGGCLTHTRRAYDSARYAETLGYGEKRALGRPRKSNLESLDVSLDSALGSPAGPRAMGVRLG